MAEKRMTVIIEIGSCEVSGAAGYRDSGGRLEVVAYAAEQSGEFIKNGIVRNIDKTAQCLTNIVNRLEEQLKGASVNKVYVGIGGYTFHSTHRTVKRSFDEETRITAEFVDEMTEECQEAQSPDKFIIRSIPQEYTVDSMLTKDPVGCNCRNILGDYLNLEARFSIMDNLASSFDMAKTSIADEMVIPLLLADNVLSDTDRNLGCALVDMGAGTTTVTVYKGGCLRFLSVIPLGSALITSDLATLGINLGEAEQIKKTVGISTGKADEAPYVTESGEAFAMATLALVSRARFQEIIANVLNQIKMSGYTDDKLNSGIVFTGGGMEMPGVEAYLGQQAHFPKFRIARSKPDAVVWSAADMPMEPKRLVLATLLAAGDDDCVSVAEPRPMEIDFTQQEQMSTGSLFTDEGEDAQAERDRKAAEESARRREEMNEKKKKEKEKEILENKPRKKSIFERIRDKAQQLMDDENE